jgi:hypothetical protein
MSIACDPYPKENAVCLFPRDISIPPNNRRRGPCESVVSRRAQKRLCVRGA